MAAKVSVLIFIHDRNVGFELDLTHSPSKIQKTLF
jgi:hypothetical protein